MLLKPEGRRGWGSVCVSVCVCAPVHVSLKKPEKLLSSSWPEWLLNRRLITKQCPHPRLFWHSSSSFLEDGYCPILFNVFILFLQAFHSLSLLRGDCHSARWGMRWLSHWWAVWPQTWTGLTLPRSLGPDVFAGALMTASVVPVSICASTSLLQRELFEGRDFVSSALHPALHLVLPNAEALSFIKWSKQYVNLYIYRHLVCPCSHIFSVYIFFVLHMKNSLLCNK